MRVAAPLAAFDDLIAARYPMLLTWIFMQLAGACSNPEVGVELRRMASAAAAIQLSDGVQLCIPPQMTSTPRGGGLS